MAQDYSKMSNGELFGLLRQRGLSHIGTKADIVARLQKDDAQKTPADAQAVAPEEHTKDLGDEIGATAISEAVVAAVSEDTLNSLSPVVRHTIYDCLGFPVNKNRKLRLQFHDWQLGELPVRSHYIFADGQGELAITQDEYELVSPHLP